MHDGWQYLVLMRHGHSFANAAIKQGGDSHFYSITGSDDRVELDEVGKLEMACAAGVLSGLFPSQHALANIWTSSFRRVTQSEQIISAKLGYQPRCDQDPRLAKRSYGEFWNLSYRGVEELYPEEHKRYLSEGKLQYRPPGGENYYDLFARVDQFFEQKLRSVRGNTLVLTHSVVFLALQRRLDGLSDAAVWSCYEAESVRNGSAVFYRRRERNEPWQFFAAYVPELGQLTPAQIESLVSVCAARENCCVKGNDDGKRFE